MCRTTFSDGMAALMGIGCRPMRVGEEDVVAMMLRKVPPHLGLPETAKVTGQSLRDNAELVHITVALDSGLLLGVCSWLITYSSWHGMKGMLVCDLFVMEHKRGSGIGEKLLRSAAKEAEKLGAGFIKLESNSDNFSVSNYFRKKNFKPGDSNEILSLDPDDFAAFIEGSVA
jgi:GNAT superfamily N-acetyltransferase